MNDETPQLCTFNELSLISPVKSSQHKLPLVTLSKILFHYSVYLSELILIFDKNAGGIKVT